MRKLGGIREFPSEVKAFEAELRQRVQRVIDRVRRHLGDLSSPERLTEADAALSEIPLPNDLSQAIATIRASLGLSITELAEATSASRQTIYAWIRGENEPQTAKRNRLRVLYHVACQWNELSPRPAKEYVPEIRDLLKSDISPEQVIAKLKEAEKGGSRRRPRKSDLAALLAKHNIDIDDLPDQDEQFDLMTGKADGFGDYDEQGD